MKVIKKGKDRKKRFRARCPSCDSKLEYKEKDVAFTFGLTGGWRWWIECPVCDGVIPLLSRYTSSKGWSFSQQTSVPD